MKSINLRFITTMLGMLSLVFFIACSNGEDVRDEETMDEAMSEEHMMEDGEMDHSGNMHASNANHQEGGMAMDYTAQTPDAFQQQLAMVVDEYQKLKEALVETDASAAATAASGVLNVTGEVNADILEADAKDYWMQQRQAMEEPLNAIASAGDIEVQREHFSELTAPMKQSIAAFGVGDNTFFVQYCPMAFNNEGATWISDEEAVRNPYFGGKMLKCGSVQETLGRN